MKCYFVNKDMKEFNLLFGAMRAPVRAVTTRTRMHFQVLVGLKVAGAHSAVRSGCIRRLAQAGQVPGAGFDFFLLFFVSVQVRFQAYPRDFLVANGASDPRQVLVNHADVVAQNVARLVLALTQVALKLKFKKWI